MGVGDQFIGAGLARGAAKRGVRIAFGDGSKIMWDAHSEMIFRNNPNIAGPREQRADNLEWVEFYRGHRMYNRAGDRKWIWNHDFRVVPGEIFLSRDERKFGEAFGRGFVLIEPNLPHFKQSSPNKEWPVDRYQAVADALIVAGHEVAQFVYTERGIARVKLQGVRALATPNFRLAAAAMKQASLYIGPEGGLHHCAAALDKPAVVLFGGWIPPSVTGYATHANLTGGGGEACGRFDPCLHCRVSMNAIKVDDVLEAAGRFLNTGGS